MRNILCFGDSNTYGLIPGTNDRYSFAEVIAKGAERLIRQIRSVAKVSEILLISPINLGDDVKDFDAEFSDISMEVSKKFPRRIEKLPQLKR